MLRAVAETLYFVPNPKSAADWFSKFFEQPLCCVEGPEHQCRLRVGEHEIRFERHDSIQQYTDGQVACWEVDEVGAAVLHACKLQARVARGPHAREDGTHQALVQVPHDGGLVGLVGPLWKEPERTLEARVHRARGGWISRTLRVTGAVQAELEYSGVQALVGVATAFGAGAHSLRVDGIEVVVATGEVGKRVDLPFRVGYASGAVAGLVSVRLGQGWTGFYQVAELSVTLNGRKLYEEKPGETRQDQDPLPIPATGPDQNEATLPRAASGDDPA